MKRVVCLFAAIFAVYCMTLPISAQELRSESYVVLDAHSGQVLAEKNADVRLYPASITKILTCALALQLGNPADTTTMSADAVFSIGRDTTHIALTDGEVISVDSLLKATMIESANDAANGLAEYISGDLDTFAVLMNQTASEAGAVNSNFLNAHGLHDKNHYTTAYDMAVITRWALEIDGFRELFASLEHTIAPTNKQDRSRSFGSHHHMMVEGNDYYDERITGGKLGWTPEAQHTLVSLAEYNGLEVIVVVMKTTTQYEKYLDTAALLDECFESYSAAQFPEGRFAHAPVPVQDASGNIVSYVMIDAKELSIARPATLARADIEVELTLPDAYTEGEEIAPQAIFSDEQGNELCRLPLEYHLEEVSASAGAPLSTLDSSGEGGFSMRPWMLAVLGVLSLGIAVLFGIRARNLSRLRRLQAQRQAAAHRRNVIREQVAASQNQKQRPLK